VLSAHWDIDQTTNEIQSLGKFSLDLGLVRSQFGYHGLNRNNLLLRSNGCIERRLGDGSDFLQRSSGSIFGNHIRGGFNSDLGRGFLNDLKGHFSIGNWGLFHHGLAVLLDAKTGKDRIAILIGEIGKNPVDADKDLITYATLVA
jgi:hypothetical protein